MTNRKKYIHKYFIFHLNFFSRSESPETQPEFCVIFEEIIE